MMKSLHLRLLLVTFSLFIQHTVAFVVTGAGFNPGGNTSNSSTKALRYEINDFATQGPPFDLFILALSQLQSQNQSDQFSYFQLAGIHGFPQVPWDGVSGMGDYPGFCMHSSVLFPVWHRPYLALFEQVLWTTALVIARQYPLSQQEIYMAAAQTLRIPYWDWAARPALPSCVTSPTITVNTPNGRQENMSNPLYQYTFHPGPEGNGIPTSQPLWGFPSTMRYYNFTTGMSDNDQANNVLLANAASTLSLTYSTLTSTNNYTVFSTVLPNGQFNGAYNIESLHNNIHIYVGSLNGQMAWPELSAFDPVFWLHHANVDRLIAMWQAVNPQSYVTPSTNEYGTYYEVAGSVDTEHTTLAPFHSDNTSTRFHTPDTVRDFSVFRYTYPEFLGLDHLNGTALASIIKTRINQLYAPIQEYSKRSLKLDHATKVEEAFGNVSYEMAKSLQVNHCPIQWSIEVVTSPGGSHDSYIIDFFMGKLPEIGESSKMSNLIATFGQFKLAPYLYGSTTSRGYHGGVSITHSLLAGVERGFLKNLSAASVVPALHKHLSWRARASDGCEIDLTTLPGLNIRVQSRRVRPRKAENEFPEYGLYEVHFNATAGKTGGAG